MKVSTNYSKNSKKSGDPKPEVKNGRVKNPEKIREVMKKALSKESYRRKKNHKVNEYGVRVPAKSKTGGGVMKGERLRYKKETDKAASGRPGRKYTVDKKTGSLKRS